VLIRNGMSLLYSICCLKFSKACEFSESVQRGVRYLILVSFSNFKACEITHFPLKQRDVFDDVFVKQW